MIAVRGRQQRTVLVRPFVLTGFVIALVFGVLVEAATANAASDPTDLKRLRDALSGFDGDWTGEVIIWGRDGEVLSTVPARRRHRWVGDVQIAVMAFELGEKTVSVRMRRWIENGQLRAIVYWPANPPDNYRGEFENDGIAWVDQNTGYRRLADRLVREDGVRKLEATSVETILLTPGSSQVVVDGVFERDDDALAAAQATANQAAEAQIAELEVQLIEESAGPPAVATASQASESSATVSPPSTNPQVSAPTSLVGEDLSAATPTDPLQELQAEPGLGSVYVSSDPPYVPFVIRPAEPNPLWSETEREGTTPFLVENLPPGRFVVTFKRSGWPEQSGEVVIVENVAASMFHRFVGGAVEITSEPRGARVHADGRLVGQTPLSMRNVPPGEITFTISRAGFSSVERRGEVRPNRSLVLQLELEVDDSVVSPDELDEGPVPRRQVAPDLRGKTVPSGITAVVELTVDRRGRPQDLRLVSADDETFGELCLAAAARWRFTPGRIGEQPVSTRVKLPFVIE